MKKSLLFLPAIALMALSHTARAQTVPQFDLTGNWLPGAGGVSSFFQKGTQLDLIYVNADFAHRFVGDYTSSTQIEGRMNRVTRATGCVTNLRVTINARSADSISVSAKARDSNCDLVRGEIYTDTNSRLP